MNYNNKRFKLVSTADNGDLAPDIVFTYKQEGNVLTANYSSEHARNGQILGLVDDQGNIDMRYQHLNSDGKLMTGICKSTPELLSNSKIRLHENWQWTSGDRSKGSSILEEI